MKIPLDRQAPTPIYLQIHDRIASLIHKGHLSPGAQLPSIRKLAQTAQVNKLTVMEAYSVLEADGLVQAKRGAGYFINSPDKRQPLISRPQKTIRESTGETAAESAAANISLTPTFNPTQTVILPGQGVDSFPATYRASIHSHEQSGYIDFSQGFCQPVGAEELQRIARRAMKSSATFFRNVSPEGDRTLRSQIAQLLIQQGLEISPDNIILTNGSMQALSLLVDHFVEAGDWVIVEAPTYHGFLSVLQQRNAQVIGIPMTATGMNLELLAQYLKSHRPKLIYTISTLHNPTGITTTLSHRRALLQLANQYNCQIIEDNAYEPLSFGLTPPPIKALDTSDRAIYIGTFSKALMPGLRVGYMAITGEEKAALSDRKLLHDFHISTASQAIVKEYLTTGHYRRRLDKIRKLHRTRRDFVLSAIVRHFPENVTWTVPDGGTFLWVQLPDGICLKTLVAEAAQQKVLIGSGAGFFPTERGYPAFRLNFSLPPEVSEKGIQRIGSILKRLTA